MVSVGGHQCWYAVLGTCGGCCHLLLELTSQSCHCLQDHQLSGDRTTLRKASCGKRGHQELHNMNQDVMDVSQYFGHVWSEEEECFTDYTVPPPETPSGLGTLGEGARSTDSSSTNDHILHRQDCRKWSGAPATSTSCVRTWPTPLRRILPAKPGLRTKACRVWDLAPLPRPASPPPLRTSRSDARLHWLYVPTCRFLHLRSRRSRRRMTAAATRMLT